MRQNAALACSRLPPPSTTTMPSRLLVNNSLFSSASAAERRFSSLNNSPAQARRLATLFFGWLMLNLNAPVRKFSSG